jgi:hypothetical protein
MSIIHWLQNAKPKADVIIIMDPDCLMFKPVDIVRSRVVAAARKADAAAGGGAGPPDRPKGIFRLSPLCIGWRQNVLYLHYSVVTASQLCVFA